MGLFKAKRNQGRKQSDDSHRHKLAAVAKESEDHASQDEAKALPQLGAAVPSRESPVSLGGKAQGYEREEGSVGQRASDSLQYSRYNRKNDEGGF